MRLNVEKTIERALLQVNGMEKYAKDAEHAPIPTETIKNEALRLQALKTTQDSLKAQLHQTTQELNALTKGLDQEAVRNVSYFIGLWGKTDKRLEEVGGHALAKPVRHKTPLKEAA